MMTYDREQSRWSPLGMRSYESIDANSPTFRADMFLYQDGIYLASQPCFSGDRVWSYDNVFNLRKYICDMSHAFTRLFDSNEIGVNADQIATFNKYCSATNSKWCFYRGTGTPVRICSNQFIRCSGPTSCVRWCHSLAGSESRRMCADATFRQLVLSDIFTTYWSRTFYEFRLFNLWWDYRAHDW